MGQSDPVIEFIGMVATVVAFIAILVGGCGFLMIAIGGALGIKSWQKIDPAAVALSVVWTPVRMILGFIVGRRPPKKSVSKRDSHHP